MIVRQSGLKQFGNCAQQYFLSEVLGIGKELSGSLTVMGTVWHYAVEVYEEYDNDLDLAKRTFAWYWEHPEELGERVDFYHRSTTWQGLLERGLKMLDEYHELLPFQGALVGTEIRFEVPIGDHTLQGTIDKLWIREGQKRLEVVDIKTGAHVPEKLRYNIQFTAYCYATMRPEFWANVTGFEDGYTRFANYQRGGWWYHARNNKMWNAGDREALDYQRLYLAVTEMDKAVQADIYPLDIKGENCGYCPFVNDVCGSGIPNPVEL